MPSSLNGTGLTFNGGATLNSPPVTSVATGNGLSGGTITTTGTLTIAAPAFNTVGSYIFGFPAQSTNIGSLSYSQTTAGSNLRVLSTNYDGCNGYYGTSGIVNPSLSGTWRCLGGGQATYGNGFLWVRIS
jgi:hypothetical protein